MLVNSRGITVWKGLSESVKSSVSLNIFKNRLKKKCWISISSKNLYINNIYLEVKL